MAKPILKPHILIEADPILARDLVDSCSTDEKPFVLSANPVGTWISPKRMAQGFVRIGSSLEGLIRLELHNDGDEEPRIELQKALPLVRDHFGLKPSDRIRVAMAGTHTSLSGMFDGTHFHQGLNANRDRRTTLEDAMRKGRTLVGLVEAALTKLEVFELMWLAEAFPALRPEPAAGRYTQLAGLARAQLAEFELPPFKKSAQSLRQPAVPLIFVTRDPRPDDPACRDDARWEPMGRGERDHPYSVTQKLIGQFKAARANDSRLRGVLVKLLPSDLSRQNVLDAPMVGQSTIEDVYKAEIEAILLDAARGIVRPPFDSGVTTERVFGIPPGQTVDP